MRPSTRAIRAGPLLDREGRWSGSIPLCFVPPGSVSLSLSIWLKGSLDQLLEHGKVIRLGVVGGTLTPQIAGSPRGAAGISWGRPGAYVLRVMSDTPAARGGIQPGDVIVEVNGQKIDSIEEMADLAQRGRVRRFPAIGAHPGCQTDRIGSSHGVRRLCMYTSLPVGKIRGLYCCRHRSLPEAAPGLRTLRHPERKGGKLSDPLSSGRTEQVLKAEGERLLAAVPPDSFVVALTPQGRLYSSPEPAKLMGDLNNPGAKQRFGFPHRRFLRS